MKFFLCRVILIQGKEFLRYNLAHPLGDTGEKDILYKWLMILLL